MRSLHLSDGTTYSGASFGSQGNSDGEVVFSTGMAGYPESLTDPSFRGQILVFTYPLIGNYGVPSEEKNDHGFSKNLESEAIHVRGVIVAQESGEYSHHRAVSSLDNWLKHHKIPGITGVDTRSLTKKLREHGVMLGSIQGQQGEQRQLGQPGQVADPNLKNLVAEVSCSEVITYDPEDSNSKNQHSKTVVAYDCGMKRNIIRSFLRRGIRVHRVPWNYDLSTSDLEYDGVFISNGPGDPKMCKETIAQIQFALKKEIPTFGICLGNQLLALAIGGDTYKLKYGHRGVNQPCIIEGTKRCLITSQNHGYAVSENLPKDWSVWFRNANDGTVEGIRHSSGKFFSVQFHPEATPGPEDANDLFDEFLAVL